MSLVLNTKDSEGEDVSYELEEGKDYVLTGEKSSSEAGDHTFTIEGIGNFNSSIEQSYHIGKVPLTITANDHSIKFGDAPSDNGVTYDGLKDGDSEEDLDGELKISVDYKQFEDIDENGFDIVAQGLSSDNYVITYVSGKLTVEPIDMSDENIEMTIEPEEFTDDKTERRPQVTLTLNTKDKDGNDVSYTLVEGKDYTLSGDISSSEVGDHSIIATGTGNFKGTCEGAWTIKEKDDDEDIEKESFDVGNGKVVFETDVNAKGIAIKVTDLTKEVALAALSPEDIARVEAGETAFVYLEINVIDKLPEEDKAITEDKLDEISAKPCVYLDITLWKKIGNDPVESVSSMNNNEVTIDVEVPEEFHNRDKNIERNFYVLRTHEGVASVLAGPTTATTISFKTGLFSSYTIAYRDRIIDRPYVIPVTGVE